MSNQAQTCSQFTEKDMEDLVKGALDSLPKRKEMLVAHYTKCACCTERHDHAVAKTAGSVKKEGGGLFGRFGRTKA